MATVTFKMIDKVYDNLTETVIDTASGKLSPEEQDRRLAESCRQACQLLKDWLESDVWNGMRATTGGAIANFAKDQEQFDRLLPTLKDVLERASGHLINALPEYVNQARKALKAAADRDQELFQKAEKKVSALREEVCELAKTLDDLNTASEKKTLARVRARDLLAKVKALVPVLVIAMAGVTPSQATNNLTQWGREALKVVAIQDIAARAELQDRQPRPPHGDTQRGRVPAPPTRHDNWGQGPKGRTEVPKPGAGKGPADRDQGKGTGKGHPPPTRPGR